ncbi:hypothetical protein LTR10_023255 [Elasticomyces elasticus]|uniref:Uncharacterized protein n=1 Tax=Exophiala sideris TaxID=1016849 RepID=A0ABR0J3C0_9EURO|nr:hypothetical protein LTR10_023255 [Elasticomyces elasticus]KAK5024747.1 hypothetical protein LTS07_008593 [Exophiala sideris]KAK5030840.1 hypothetical protein LTR13_008194 [Exophiala sideris]KAK5054382.1 hypothetical protein LTR69_008997 [Exophiala sideris]KAK5179782.1 hypothetical protein LTR44_007950 [Eurotiomycetes sp. CCFEE 6388]
MSSVLTWITQFPLVLGTGSDFPAPTNVTVVSTNATSTSTSSTSTVSSTSTSSSSTSLSPSSTSSSLSTSQTTTSSISQVSASSTMSVSTSSTVAPSPTSTVASKTTSTVQTSSSPPSSTPPSSSARMGTKTFVYTVLTTRTTDYSIIDVSFCNGYSEGGTEGCLGPWQLQTIITTDPPASEKSLYCESWTAPFSTTSPAKASVLNCATPVSGSATKELPTAWPSDSPFSPFGDMSFEISDFCESITKDQIFLNDGDPNGQSSPAECALYSAPFQNQIAVNEYPIVIGLTFDYNGCDSPTDKYRNGVNMSSYGSKECINVFTNNLVKKCKFNDNEVKKWNLEQWKQNTIGGMYWQDCMRWTLMAVNWSAAPPNILPSHSSLVLVPSRTSLSLVSNIFTK